MMFTLYTPKWVRKNMFDYGSLENLDQKIIDQLKTKFKNGFTLEPDVSVVIPAWNEERNLARTLWALSNQKTKYSYEVIVVDNNSKDKTRELAEACGIKVIPEPSQGIRFARQIGLLNARGQYVLCADSDTIYPEKWIEYMTDALIEKNVSCVYSTYSLIPHNSKLRISLSAYEFLSSILFKMRRKYRAYLNVMGFSFGFRKLDAIRVGGFNLNMVHEDGWIALQLMQYGKIKAVDSVNAKVWTSSRRLMVDGSIYKAFKKRIKKEVKRLKEYVFVVPIKKEITIHKVIY